MSFEKLVVFNCAPALAGIKPSNLFTWHFKDCVSEREHRIRDLAAKLAPYGIDVDTLCECPGHSLVFIYRADMVENHLSVPEAKKILMDNGYSSESTLREKIEMLKLRLKNSNGFPHEIGIFLGYPAEDVAGFITNKGGGCKLCGNWKVYGDEEKARAAFQKYEKCRDFFCERFSVGNDIAEIMENIKIPA